MANENPGMGCLTYELTKRKTAELQAAVDKVEALCKQLAIPGMCIVQYANLRTRFKTITFSERNVPKSDAMTDVFIQLEKLFFDKDISPADCQKIIDLVSTLYDKYQEKAD